MGTGRIAFDFGASDATFAAVSGHKLGGPTGSGAFLVKRGVTDDDIAAAVAAVPDSIEHIRSLRST